MRMRSGTRPAPVSMVINMAANFAETWQACAFDDKEYAKSDVYSNILQVLVSSEHPGNVELKGSRKELSPSRLRDSDLSVLVRALSTYGRVTELDLSCNAISDAGIDSLAEYLKDPKCSLVRLDLSQNDFTELGADTLSTSLQFNTSVTALVLNGCKIGPKGGIHIASMLQINRSLTHLGLAYTDLDTDCIIAMATVLHGNQTLRSVDLSRPLLHSRLEESTIHLSRMLQVNDTLQELCLSKHSMTDSGCEWLCRHLLENTALTHLDVSSNSLSRDAGRHFANLLRSNSTLTSLDLSCNHIEDYGLVDISAALLVNTTLTSLKVCYNKIVDRGMCELAGALKRNSTLSEVYIWGNHIGQHTCDAFRDLLETSRLIPDRTDVQFYIVDGVTQLARTHHHAY